MAETEVRCPLKDCEYNKFGGRCIKRVITLERNFRGSNNIRCYDYKLKER